MLRPSGSTARPARALLLSVLSSLAACASEGPSDPGTAVPPGGPGEPPAPAAPLRWSASIPHRDSVQFQRIAVEPGRVYVLTDVAILAFDSDDGSRIWERTGTRIDFLAGYRSASGGGGTLMHATAGGGRLVISTPSSSVALRGTDGAIEWTASVSRWGTHAQSQIADAEAVYSLDDYGGVVALDARTGAERWRQRLEVATYLAGPLALRGDRLLVGAHATEFGFGTAVMADLDRLTGRVGALARWTLTPGPGLPPIPVAAGDGLAGFDARTQSLVMREAGTLAVRWSVPLAATAPPLPRIGPLAADSARVYFAAPLDSLSAFDGRSGARLWSAPLVQPAAVLTCGTSVFTLSEAGVGVIGFATRDTVRPSYAMVRRSDGAERATSVLHPGRPADVKTDGRLVAIALRDSLHVVTCP